MYTCVRASVCACLCCIHMHLRHHHRHIKTLAFLRLLTFVEYNPTIYVPVARVHTSILLRVLLLLSIVCYRTRQIEIAVFPFSTFPLISFRRCRCYCCCWRFHSGC